MASTAAATCRVYATGTSTSMTTEACTLSGGNTVAQITNTAKRILDPTATINLYDNGVLQSASSYTLNHAFGKATKISGSWTGPVTITANYLPRLELDETYSAELDLAREALVDTVFKSAAYQTCILGLFSAAITLKMRQQPNKDFDPGAGSLKMETWLTSEQFKVVEVEYSDGTIFRAYARANNVKHSDEVAGLHDVQVGYVASGESGLVKAFAFSDE